MNKIKLFTPPTQDKGNTPIQLILIYRTQIMCFAAIWIMLSHCLGAGFHQFRILEYLKPLIRYGVGGVDIFLFISGLGIALSLQKPQTASLFFKKRILKIFPIFFIIVTVYSLLMNDQLLDWFYQVSTLSMWLPLFSVDVISVFWYVGAAFTFYAISWVCYRYFVKYPLLVTIGLSSIGLIIFYTLQLDTLKIFLMRFPIYFAGMYASHFCNRNFNPIYLIALSVVAYGVLGICSSLLGGEIISRYGINFLMLALIAPGLSILIASICNFLNCYSVARPIINTAGYIGIMSLEIYLVHWGLICIMKKYSLEYSLLTFFAISFLVAYIVHLIISKAYSYFAVRTTNNLK